MGLPEIIRMKPHHIDISGQKFGHLLAIRKVGTWVPSAAATSGGGCKKAIWECRCDCGKIVNIKSTKLRSGMTRSCGGCEAAGLIGIDGRKFGSILEAAHYMRLKESGVPFEHDKRYPGSRMRFDFHVPYERLYVEVSSYDRSFRGWDGYVRKIDAKRRHVEDILGCRFEFVNRATSSEERRSVMAVASFLTRRKRLPHPKVKVDWGAVDWSQSDAEVVALTGRSVSVVRRGRHRHAPSGFSAWDLRMAGRWSGVDWTRSNAELAKSLGKSEASISINRKRFGHPSRFLSRV